MDRDWYINECLRQLNNTKFYKLLDNDITTDIQKRIRKVNTPNAWTVTKLSTKKLNAIALFVRS